MRKIFALLLCFTICANSVGVLAGTVYATESEQTNLSAGTQAQTDARQTPDSLDNVYVSGTGTPDASGADGADPISDLNRALSVVRKNGTVHVIGDVTVTDVQFPNKMVIISGEQKADSSRPRITFAGDVNFRMTIYINNLDLEFKNPVFANGNVININESVILGYPDIYLGSKNANVEYGPTGSLNVINSAKMDHQINNIYMAGYQNYEIAVASVELKNVSIRGKIDGTNVTLRSNVMLTGEVTVPVIENVLKIILDDHSRVHVTDRIRNVRELYGNAAQMILDNQVVLTIEYLYGNMKVDFTNPIVPRDFIVCQKLTGNLSLSEQLASQGYHIEKIRSGNELKIALMNGKDGSMHTNYFPSIKHTKDMVVFLGNSVDLRKGVSAWDFEDKDITDRIVYPNVDVSKLPVGDHKVEYQVTDKQGNTTKSILTIHVVGNPRPVIEGVQDVELSVKDVERFNLRTGITVKDDKDKDIVLEVEGSISRPAPGTEETFVITYRAEDSDHNVTTVTRKIHITNFVPQIKGLSDVVIDRDDPFDFMKGVTASDPEDGKIEKITIENPVDVSRAGKYEVVYTATDSDSNTTKAVRNVTVKDWVDWTEIEQAKPVQPPKPEPTAPKPTEPKPTTPKPTEPKPTTPESTEPKPTVPVTYTVRFQSNGGSEIAAVSGSKGTAVDLSKYVPTRAGFDFAGWYSDAKFTERVTSVNLTQNMTVYAKWTEKVVENPFADVPSDKYYCKPVLWAVSNRITAGVSETKFGPDQNCTRGQIVTFLWSAAGKPKPKTTQNPFTDVSREDYFYDAVLWAVENGITSGISADRFGPGKTCTRAQAVTFLWSAQGKPGVSGAAAFNDVDASDYFHSAVQWAVANNVTAGVGGDRFGSSQTCTRAQIVTFLYQIYG